jgi:hypothetical protein
MSYQLNEVDIINEQIAQQTVQRKSAMLKEKVNVFTKIKVYIKLYGFKISVLKGVLAKRKKRCTGTVTKKTVVKKITKLVYNGKGEFAIRSS